MDQRVDEGVRVAEGARYGYAALDGRKRLVQPRARRERKTERHPHVALDIFEPVLRHHRQGVFGQLLLLVESASLPGDERAIRERIRRHRDVAMRLRDLGRLREPAIGLLELAPEIQGVSERAANDVATRRLRALEVDRAPRALVRGPDVAPRKQGAKRRQARLE